MKECISPLDSKGENLLLEDEVEELHVLIAKKNYLSHIDTSICWQQSRLTLLREGDANSKIFNGVISSRRRGNSIPSILVEGVQVEGVGNMRSAIFSHFATHFEVRNVERPGADDLQFSTLSFMEGVKLIKLFRLEEVKATI